MVKNLGFYIDPKEEENAFNFEVCRPYASYYLESNFYLNSLNYLFLYP